MVLENEIDLSINIILYNLKKVQSQILILCIFFSYYFIHGFTGLKTPYLGGIPGFKYSVAYFREFLMS